MKYKLVAAFNRRIGCFMPVQAINDMLDEDIIESNRRAVLNGTIPEEQAIKLTVHRVGEFDDTTGQITACSPVLLCDLASFIPRKDKTEEVVKDGEQCNNANQQA